MDLWWQMTCCEWMTNYRKDMNEWVEKYKYVAQGITGWNNEYEMMWITCFDLHIHQMLLQLNTCGRLGSNYVLTLLKPKRYSFLLQSSAGPYLNVFCSVMSVPQKIQHHLVNHYMPVVQAHGRNDRFTSHQSLNISPNGRSWTFLVSSSSEMRSVLPTEVSPVCVDSCPLLIVAPQPLSRGENENQSGTDCDDTLGQLLI